MEKLEIGFENATINGLTFVRGKFDEALNKFIDKTKKDLSLPSDEVIYRTINRFNPFYFIEGLEFANNIDINPRYNDEGNLTHIDFDSYEVYDSIEEEYTMWDDIHWSVVLRDEQVDAINKMISEREG